MAAVAVGRTVLGLPAPAVRMVAPASRLPSLERRGTIAAAAAVRLPPSRVLAERAAAEMQGLAGLASTDPLLVPAAAQSEQTIPGSKPQGAALTVRFTFFIPFNP
jgi:hypothetical protein